MYRKHKDKLECKQRVTGSQRPDDLMQELDEDRFTSNDDHDMSGNVLSDNDLKKVTALFLLKIHKLSQTAINYKWTGN